MSDPIVGRTHKGPGRLGGISPDIVDLARRFGGDARNGYAAVPTPGHSPRDRGTVIRERADGRGLVVHSFNNSDWRGLRDDLGLEKDVRPPTRGERRRLAHALAKQRAHREAAQLARASELALLSVTPRPSGAVWTYLVDARDIPPALVAAAIRVGALLENRDAQGRVSMLARAHNAGGKFRALQLTKLRENGYGKRGDPPRLSFGPIKGAAARLLPLTGDTLAVSEGVETALAFAALREISAWATFGASNLRAFEPPRGVRRLIIAADGDAPGMDAARALFDRLCGKLRVIIAPAPEGLDWADLLAIQRGARHG